MLVYNLNTKSARAYARVRVRAYMGDFLIVQLVRIDFFCLERKFLIKIWTA